jgi:hypothetical protein
MNLLRSLAVVAVTAGLSACAENTTLSACGSGINRSESAECGQVSALPEQPDFSGTLAEFRQAPVAPGYTVRLLVEGDSPPPADLATVHVGKKTEIRIVQPGGQVREGTLADLAVRDELRVWTTGTELRSYPVQVFATRIDIIR